MVIASVPPGKPSPTRPVKLLFSFQISQQLKKISIAQRQSRMFYKDANHTQFAFGIIRLGDNSYFLQTEPNIYLRLRPGRPFVFGDLTFEVDSNSASNLSAKSSNPAGYYSQFQPLPANLMPKINPIITLTVAELLKPENAPHLLEVENILRTDANRPLNLNQEPGALVELNGDKKVILVGDLHDNLDNLDKILKKYGPALMQKEITLCILGDAIHPEEVANPKDAFDAENSIKMSDAVMNLKRLFPDNFYYVRGNHDDLDETSGYISKNFQFTQTNARQEILDCVRQFPKYIYNSGNDQMTVAQGLVFAGQLIQARGKEYMRRLKSIFLGCPLAIKITGNKGQVFAAHAPVLTPAQLTVETGDKHQLVGMNIVINAPLNRRRDKRGMIDPSRDPVFGLTWNKAYKLTTTELELTAKILGLQPDAVFIGGHIQDHATKPSVFAPPSMQGNMLAMQSQYTHELSVIEVVDGVPSQVRIF